MPKPRTRLKHQLFKSQARTAACSILANALPTQSGEAIVFRPIDALALDAFNGWGDGVHFSWEEVPLWKAREPWSFDLSIWCGSELCGLCFANPNQSRLRTKIIRLEGNPDIRHPLKNRVAAVAMLAVEHYAQKVGSRWLEIQEPAQEAMKVYQELGFKFDAFGRLVIDLKKV
ncbi:GNAT family N-acetyltransferase [Pseudomonas sp. NKUCC02_KPG]|uniref:GNAT family N-acetyltransferase n=2 Tax=unclassified Pseudomonas TaxID=196821 RepID=UPI001C5B507A|nr:GNAT family N-acetyltransferase [Pseudomonas sp. NKUCC02_KPG]MBW3507230.1 GNAT family N-acetyltransferase [Pseudomonas sp. NKUCC02_KPG]